MRALLVLWLLLAAPAAHAADRLGSVDGVIREAVTVPLAVAGKSPASLEAVVTRPAGAGRHPFMLLSHGVPRKAEERADTAPNWYSAVAIEFAERGWAVLTLVRRGYGHSDGPYAESTGSCTNEDYLASGRAAALDLEAGIAFMSRQAFADPSRVMLAGISAGGFSSIATAAQRPPGLVAVLNFAGGRGSSAPDFVCQPERLVAAYGSYGRTVLVPTLWVYAQNDHFFGPGVARQFFAAFTQAGGQGEFVALPAFGEDGHQLLSSAGVALWRDRVDQFLRAHGLPTWARPVEPPLPPIPPFAGWNGASLKEFDRYRAALSFEKALAVGHDGGFSWVSGRRSEAEAIADAVSRCSQRSSGCRPYAVGDRLVR